MAVRSEHRAGRRARRRLASAVRRHAGEEAALLRRRGVVDFRELSRRMALYELIALRLEAGELPIEPQGLERVSHLLDEASGRDPARRTTEVWAPALIALDPAPAGRSEGLLSVPGATLRAP